MVFSLVVAPHPDDVAAALALLALDQARHPREGHHRPRCTGRREHQHLPGGVGRYGNADMGDALIRPEREHVERSGLGARPGLGWQLDPLPGASVAGRHGASGVPEPTVVQRDRERGLSAAARHLKRGRCLGSRGEREPHR